MNDTQRVKLLYGREGIEISVPSSAVILRPAHGKALPRPSDAIRAAIDGPIGAAPLADLLKRKRPKRVVITISDITRPVPNTVILPEILRVLGEQGIPDSAVTILVATGMHRPSTPEEKIELAGPEILRRIRVIDHRADDPAGLMHVSDEPPVSVNRTFMEADFRIVTGLIEPHFMAGYSGGRKGICPALVDLHTVQRFHGHKVMGDPHSTNGLLDGNPCHVESLRIARLVPMDFLVNVAINGRREICGVYAGDMEKAHAAGVADVARWTSARVEKPFDLVVTSGGGYPLDKTFYQTGKGFVTALPACHAGSTILIAAECEEGVGSDEFTEQMLEWCGPAPRPPRWREFLEHIKTTPVTRDQWQVQMICRVMELVGDQRVLLVSDGLSPQVQGKLWVQHVPAAGTPSERTQQALDAWLSAHPAARIAVIPDGPYTMLASKSPS